MEKQKTIREWLQELPEPYRSQALKYNRDFQQYVFLLEKPSLSSSLYAAFEWRESQEGHEYWRELFLKLLEKENLKGPILDKAHPNSIDAIEKVPVMENKKKVYHFIRTNGPITRQDLSSKLSLPINIICGRVNELLKEDIIEEDGYVKVELSGRFYKRALLKVNQ